MLLPNRHGGAPDYHYGFQGQEMDNEVKGEGNSLNYKFRMHDPRVGKFFATDPLTHLYPHYTTYSFAGNNVIAYKELEGLEESPAYLSDQHIFEGPSDGIDGPDAIQPKKNGYIKQEMNDAAGWVINFVSETLGLLSLPGQLIGHEVEQAIINLPDENGNLGFRSDLPTTDVAVRAGNEEMFYASLANEQRALVAGAASSYTNFMFDALVLDGAMGLAGSGLSGITKLPLEKVKIKNKA